MSANKTTSDYESKQNESAGPEETKAKPFPAIDFFHRVSDTYQKPEKLDSWELNRGIDCIVTRAESVLSMASDQFARDEDDGGKLNDSIMFYSLQSVVMDLKDIRSLVSAFAQAEHEKMMQKNNRSTPAT